MPKTVGLSRAEAQRKVVEALASGLTVKDACALVGRSTKTYENWRAEDADFRSACDEARARRKRAVEAGKDADVYQLDFATWRKRFLGRDTYPHQQQWIDVLEGREPADLHPSMRYHTGAKNRVVINTPPFMAKSTVITQEWVTYRLCMNPNLRVLIVSETKDLAAQFLYSIKRMLTEPHFAELQAAYAPTEGFKPARGEGTWGADKIYINGRGDDAADPASKDPSVQALGMKGRIYGQRADLVILDDAVSLKSAAGYEWQARWLMQDVTSRAKDGQILIVGTRVGAVDLYSHLLDPKSYPVTGRSPWTYLAQPMVLEFAEDPKDWKTLWPRSSQPLDENDTAEPDEDGLYPAWDGPACFNKRAEVAVSQTLWPLVYMQQEVAEDATFNHLCVAGSTDRRRKPGPMRPGEWGGRREGMQGLHVVGSIDPAGTGEAFILVYAVDRATGHRYVLNCWMGNQTTPAWYAQRIEDITPEYQVNEWVIESNGYSNWLIHDERIVSYLRMRGIPLMPHYTSNNKLDPDFGVASMASLFGGIRGHVEGGRPTHDGENLIHLPDPDKSEGVKALIDQLIRWLPGKQGRELRQDGPMALWFAELRARNAVVGRNGQRSYLDNPYLSRKDRQKQYVVPLHVVA